MKINIDRALFRFQMRMMLSDRTALVQILIVHYLTNGLVFGKKGVAAAAAADAALWTNYGLFMCSGVLVLAGAVCVGYTLVKPRSFRMVELMLATPLSLRRLAATSFASCFLFSLVNLAVHFGVIWFRFGAVPCGAGFYTALAAALAFSAFLLSCAVVVSLTRKDADQLHAVFLLVGMILAVLGLFTRLRLDIPYWLPYSLVTGLSLGFVFLWANFHRLLTKEKAVLA